MPPTPSRSSRSGVRSLLASCAILAIVWLIVLPAVARIPAVRAHIARNAASGIDPSAKFYSELPGMSVILERVDSAHRRSGAVFWNPRSLEDRESHRRDAEEAEKTYRESEK